jgi:hypothetical protein
VIPASVTTISTDAFGSCPSLTNVFFEGDAVTVPPSVFNLDNAATVYYLPGTTGWQSPVGSRPALLWNPRIPIASGGFGVISNRFGFDVAGTTNIPVVLEACSNLTIGNWTFVARMTLTNGQVHYSERWQSNLMGRFFRLRSP